MRVARNERCRSRDAGGRPPDTVRAGLALCPDDMLRRALHAALPLCPEQLAQDAPGIADLPARAVSRDGAVDKLRDAVPTWRLAVWPLVPEQCDHHQPGDP